jgi:hypothetical protein
LKCLLNYLFIVIRFELVIVLICRHCPHRRRRRRRRRHHDDEDE